MKKLFRKILSLLMSILMSIGIPATVVQEYNGDKSVQIMSAADDEEAEKKFVDQYNGIPNEDFAAYYTDDGKEIVIKSFKATGYDGMGTIYYACEKKVARIPDEIDGIPVTTIAESAFEYSGNYSRIEVETLIVGNNVNTINLFGVFSIKNIVIGKNVTNFDADAYLRDIINPIGNSTLYCYKDSAIYNFHSQHLEDRYWTLTIVLIDESHLKSEVADIDENGNIKGLPTGLTNETVKDYLTVDGDAMMEVSDEVVGTGTTVKLINSEYGTIDNTYTVILDGDINGDGNVNTAEDASAMRKIISGDDSAFSEADRLAADINGDGLVNSTDLILMKTSQN